MITAKDFVYTLACLSFSIIIGAAVYEHLAVWPRAYAAPPLSLSMFQGEYGLNADAFWMKIHPVTMIFFLAALALNWKSGRRKNILVTLIGYVVVMVVTLIYFVPELIEITSTEFSATINESLLSRGQLWENLSLVRLGFIMILAIILYSGLTKKELSNS